MAIRLINVIMLAATLMVLSHTPVDAAIDYGFISVEVADRGASSRSTAMQAGITEAIVRLSGSRQLDAELADAISNDAARYVIGYGYQQTDSLRLQLTVDWVRLRDAMVARRLPVWDFARPSVIVWLAVDNGLQRSMLAAHDPLIEQMNSVADRRGIELVWPLMDLQDQVAVSTSDVWAVFDRTLRDASERYDVSTMLVGRVSGRGERWQSRWDLIDATKSEYFALDGVSLEEVAREAVDRAVDYLGQSFAYLPEASAQAHEMVIVDIESAAEYAELIASLRSLSPILSVQPKGLTDRRVALAVQSLMSRPAMNGLLQRLGLLEPSGVAPGGVQLYRRPQVVPTESSESMDAL